MESFKERLRMLRKEKEMKQDEVADALNVSRATYSSYENGITPPMKTCIDLAAFYGVTLDYLLCVTYERKPMSGALAAAFTTLAQHAENDAPTATEVASLLEAAIKYYKAGAPCGDIPLIAFRGFIDGLRDALDAAARRSVPELIDGANATAIAALEACHMVSAMYISAEQQDNLVLLPVAARSKRGGKRLSQIKPNPLMDKELRNRNSDPVD